MQTLVVQLVAILVAFALGFLLVGIFGFDPFEVYGVLWSGSLGSIENIGWSLQNMTPLVFTGLSVALAFRAGLFNIGAEGQLVSGAFCAAVVGWAVPALAATENLSNHGFWTAHWYVKGSRVLIAAMPTRGVDIGAIEFIHKRLIALRDSGVAILLVSSELSEILSLSDRIAVIYRGRIVRTFTPEQADEPSLGLAMAGAV